MCNFLSALVLRNGDVVTHPLLDGHADLVTYFKLRDESLLGSPFAKLELRPKDWLDAATWECAIDAPEPSWWPDVAIGAEQALRDRAARMILRDGEHRLIVDGCWIIGGTAVLRDVRGGRLLRVQDQAQIHNVWGAAQIQDVRDQAQIRNVGDQAQIRNVRGAAQLDASALAHVIL